MDVRAWNEKWQHGVCARGAHVMLGLWISFNTSACHVEFVQLWLLNPLKAVVNISLLESAGSVSCTGGLWVDGDPPALYRAVSRSASAHKFQSKKKQHLCRSICFCWVFQILLFTRGRKTTEQICKCTWVTRQKNCPYGASDLHRRRLPATICWRGICSLPTCLVSIRQSLVLRGWTDTVVFMTC